MSDINPVMMSPAALVGNSPTLPVALAEMVETAENPAPVESVAETRIAATGRSRLRGEPRKRPLHRVAEMRRRRGLSARQAARRFGTSAEHVHRQEQPTSDMLLSELHQWQELLNVSLADLVVETDSPVPTPALTENRLLRLLETADSLKQAAGQVGLARLCQMLESQLIELGIEHDSTTG